MNFLRPISISLSPNTEADDVWLAFRLKHQPWLWKKGKGILALEEEFKRYLGVKHAFILASNICQKHQAPKISEAHLLQALLTPQHSSVRRVLQDLGIKPETLL